jgi:hypothetical protein
VPRPPRSSGGAARSCVWVACVAPPRSGRSLRLIATPLAGVAWRQESASGLRGRKEKGWCGSARHARRVGAPEQLIEPDASIASLSCLSVQIVLDAACSARVNSSVRRLVESS